ncbi:MAG: hypothetical protein ACE5GS_17470, partial [Kiloniellaceae bacterium]
MILGVVHSIGASPPDGVVGFFRAVLIYTICHDRQSLFYDRVRTTGRFARLARMPGSRYHENSGAICAG